MKKTHKFLPILIHFNSFISIHHILKTMISNYQRIKINLRRMIHIIPSSIPNNNVFFNVRVDTDLQPESMNY